LKVLKTTIDNLSYAITNIINITNTISKIISMGTDIANDMASISGRVSKENLVVFILLFVLFSIRDRIKKKNTLGKIKSILHIYTYIYLYTFIFIALLLFFFFSNFYFLIFMNMPFFCSITLLDFLKTITC
jgi:hypothetical protein